MKSEKEKMIDGEDYVANDRELVGERLAAKTLLHEFNFVEVAFTDHSRSILKKLLPHAHPSLYIEPPFHCDYGYNISTGENVYFNTNCVVLDVSKVSIGSNVFFGPAVQLYTASHPLNHLERRKVESGSPITIGDDCWIGGGAIVLPGVSIGPRSVIGAGSVVTRDVPPDCVVVGNPARVIRSLV